MLAAFSNLPPRPDLPNEIGVHYREENSRIVKLIAAVHVLSRLGTRGTARANLHDVVRGADVSSNAETPRLL
jgi:hypothetical protein